MIAYKFLCDGAVGRFSEFRWPMPKDGRAGEWVIAEGEVENCLTGIHACRLHDLPSWIDDELWEIELDGPVQELSSLVIAPRGRLTRRLEQWNGALALEFAVACAMRARDQAARSLARDGLNEDALRIASTLDLDELQAESAAVAATHGGAPAEAAAFVADSLALVHGRRPEMWAREDGSSDSGQSPTATAANLGFVSALAAGSAAAAETPRDPDAYQAAFASERAWQVAWLADKLGL